MHFSLPSTILITAIIPQLGSSTIGYLFPIQIKVTTYESWETNPRIKQLGKSRRNILKEKNYWTPNSWNVQTPQNFCSKKCKLSLTWRLELQTRFQIFCFTKCNLTTKHIICDSHYL